MRKFSEMQNILQSRPVTKYRLNLVACFFLEPKIYLACSDMLSYAPHHLIWPESLGYFVLLRWKRNWKKTLYSREWQICFLHDSWRSLACFSPVPIYISSTCLYTYQMQFNFTWQTLGNPPIYLRDPHHLSKASTVGCATLVQQTLGGKVNFPI